jgi:hypothetical protein
MQIEQNATYTHKTRAGFTAKVAFVYPEGVSFRVNYRNPQNERCSYMANATRADFEADWRAA